MGGGATLRIYQSGKKMAEPPDFEQPLLSRVPTGPPIPAPAEASVDDSDRVERDRSLANAEEGRAECRYCKEGIGAGPLIAPCSCKGSMQFVHAEPCLRLWLETR